MEYIKGWDTSKAICLFPVCIDRAYETSYCTSLVERFQHVINISRNIVKIKLNYCSKSFLLICKNLNIKSF
jgi:hypothetical protein